MTKRIHEKDIDQIREIIRPLLGSSAWNVKIGIGTFITMEFGNQISISPRDKRGEWYLWIYYAGWFLENPKGISIGSEDKRDILKKEVKVLEGCRLVDILIYNSAFETKFVFDDGIILHTFPLHIVDDWESWELFTPDKKVLILYPSGKWDYKPANLID